MTADIPADDRPSVERAKAEIEEAKAHACFLIQQPAYIFGPGHTVNSTVTTLYLALLAAEAALAEAWRPIESYVRTDRGETVLVATASGLVGEAWLTERDGWFWANIDPSDHYGRPIDGPLYWRSLPTPPEGKKA